VIIANLAASGDGEKRAAPEQFVKCFRALDAGGNRVPILIR
jgi:hypothetical protein